MRKQVIGCLGAAVIMLAAAIVFVLYNYTRNEIFIVLLWIVLGSWMIFGSWLNFFYKEKKIDDNGDEKVKFSEHVLRYMLYYGGALIFLSASIHVLFKAVATGFGIGLEYWPDIDQPYETLSLPRLASWLVSGVLFGGSAIALALRNRHALILMATGTVILLLGVAHDRFLLEPGTYEPGVEGDFAGGIALAIWVVGAIFLRMRGAFR